MANIAEALKTAGAGNDLETILQKLEETAVGFNRQEDAAGPFAKMDTALLVGLNVRMLTVVKTAQQQQQKNLDTIIDLPSTQDVFLRTQDGESYTVTLYNGKLDVKSFNEVLSYDGLVLKTLNGVFPACDENGMSRTIFKDDIMAKIEPKKGLKYLEAYPSSKSPWRLIDKWLPA